MRAPLNGFHGLSTNSGQPYPKPKLDAPHTGADESTVTDAFGSVKISILHALHIVQRMVEARIPLYGRPGKPSSGIAFRISVDSEAGKEP
jgi:hypothetical protein